MLRIKSVSLIKANQEVSSVDFSKGFNLVYGPSNTGKSVIVDCIDFVFGSSKPVNPNFSPKEVKLVIETEEGETTLVRVCGKTSLIVESTDVRDLECKEYPQKSKTSPTASDVIMRLMGLKERVNIISNADWKTQHLTFRTISDSFIISENNVSTEKSILLPDQVISETAYKSALIYLLTLENHIDPQGNPIEKAQKRKILINYLNSQIEKLNARMAKYDNFKVGETEEIKKEIDSLVTKIGNLQEELNTKIEESKTVSEELLSINDTIATNSNFLEKYDDLLSQYESDLRRLEMIVDGKSHEGDQEMPVRCPFCDGELQKEQEQSCEEAAQSELLKLVPQIKDLKEAKESLSLELNLAKEQREKLLTKKKEIDSVIYKELKPLISSLENKLTNYRNSIVFENDFKNDTERIEDLRTQLQEAEKMPAEAPKYKPNVYLEDLIKHRMENQIGHVLGLSGYPVNDFSFDIGKLDLIINGHQKANEGEGFRGFFNTIIALSLQKVLSDRGQIKPNLLIIDSPIMSLSEENSRSEVSDKFKKALFNCLIDASKEIQIIVVENEKPDVDYTGCNIEHFTKNPDDGRYGFIKNYKD